MSARVSDLGEWELLARLEQTLVNALPPEHAFPSKTGVVVGRGDDCAVVSPRPGTELLLETDEAVEGVHFRFDWSTPTQVGRRLAAQGLSDIAAMAGRPRWALLALSLPGDTPVERVLDLAEGFGRACAEHGVRVVGGNLSASRSDIRATITVVGEVAPGTAVLRSGARPGDGLYVTGTPGLARAGWRWLAQRCAETSVAHGPPEALQAALQSFREPRARVEEALWLANHLAPHAMIDLSDGLAGDAGHIARASGLAAVLDVSGVAADARLAQAARALDVAAEELVLAGGDDLELLFAAAREAAPSIRDTFHQRFGLPIRRVGVLEAGAGVFVADATEGSGRRPITRGSFTHFEVEPNKSS